MATSTPRMTYKIGIRAGLDTLSDKVAEDTKTASWRMQLGDYTEFYCGRRPVRPN